METIKYPSTAELGNQYYVAAATGISNTETTAITILVPEVQYANGNIATGSVAAVGANTQATLYIKYVPGSLTDCWIRIYGSFKTSPSSTDWYSETFESDTTSAPTTTAVLSEYRISLGTTDYSGATNSPIAYHFPLGSYQALKITVQSSGTITSSSLTLNLGLRVN